MYEVWQAPDVIVALGTLLAGVAACCGALVASMGLNSWKKQSKWQADRDLAISVYVALRKRHDAIKHVRNPFGWSSEYKIEESNIPEDEKRWKAVEQKFEMRWDKLTEARQEFYPVELEGDAIWGETFTKYCSDLLSLENDLLIAIQDFVESHKPRYVHSQNFQDTEEENANRMMVHGLGRRDKFGPEYQSCVSKLESFLRQKLEQDRK